MKPLHKLSMQKKGELLYSLFPQHVPLLMQRLLARANWALDNQAELSYRMGKKAAKDILKASRLLSFRLSEFSFLIRNFRYWFARLLFDKQVGFLSAMLIDRISEQFTYGEEFVHIIKAFFNSPT